MPTDVLVYLDQSGSGISSGSGENDPGSGESSSGSGDMDGVLDNKRIQNFAMKNKDYDGLFEKVIHKRSIDDLDDSGDSYGNGDPENELNLDGQKSQFPVDQDEKKHLVKRQIEESNEDVEEKDFEGLPESLGMKHLGFPFLKV